MCATSRILYLARQPSPLEALAGFPQLTIISEGRNRDGSLLTCARPVKPLALECLRNEIL